MTVVYGVRVSAADRKRSVLQSKIHWTRGAAREAAREAKKEYGRPARVVKLIETGR